jgi:hypothetical protein
MKKRIFLSVKKRILIIPKLKANRYKESYVYEDASVHGCQFAAKHIA